MLSLEKRKEGGKAASVRQQLVAFLTDLTGHRTQATDEGALVLPGISAFSP